MVWEQLEGNRQSLVSEWHEELDLVDIHGVIRADDNDYNEYQRELATAVNQVDGQSLDDVIDNQDVFIGLSDANVLSKEQVARMAQDAIVFCSGEPSSWKFCQKKRMKVALPLRPNWLITMGKPS